MKKRVINKRKVNKKGQEVFGMSFSMIFAIILIVFFIAIAIIVIKSVLDFLNCSKIGTFKQRLGDDQTGEIKKSYVADGSSVVFKGNLPTNIKYICFVNFTNEFYGPNKIIGEETNVDDEEIKNFFFYPTANACNMPAYSLLHLNINEMTKDENPYCIVVDKGNVEMTIEKENNEKLVRIKR